ncbi:S9 family peptidase [Dysgonomonas sp. 216]|uniref:S9 family peptidase n=1 Tax=Dysgonomonas sp. 216 TaxID=2302934 RepID=UPI002106CDEF|nr:S9 family peptidase [Dysgonomonas sp. 216]
MKSFSQENNALLSLDDLIPGGSTYSKYTVKMPSQLQWWGDKPVYVKGDSIMIAPLTKKDKVQLLITKKILNIGLTTLGQKELSSIPEISFPYPDSTIICFNKKDEILLYDFADKKVLASLSVPSDAANIDFSIESRRLAYTKENNLFIVQPDGKELALSKDKNEGIVSGQAVHRNEFGITKGTFWSPKGNYLAFYRMDETMVTDYPLIDMSARVAKLNNIKYPMAGMKSHQVTIGVYNVQTGDTVFLKTGLPKEKYLTNIAWAPDEKSIYVAELNRGQDTCLMKRYNIRTGKQEAVLFEESHPKYVIPENPVMFLPDNPLQFIWLSKRDGYNHMYLYNVDGTVLKQLTSGNWEVLSIIGFDAKGENVYYISSHDSPIEQHIYRLDLKKGKTTKLSKDAGIHTALLSKSGRYICDSYSSQYNPGKVAITETGKNSTHVYFEATSPYRDKLLPEITLGSVKANDGQTDLYYRMVKPTNFDPTKKYPAIVYVYGGPFSQMVTNSWMGQVRGWDIHMANKGYLVFTLDNRGTLRRGFDFENATHRQLGIVETQDQMSGVNFLKSLSYVDENRIGVHGWSYGGFMTLNLMLRHPETFKVGVAGGPVTDWHYYEIMYGERYMDSPAENRDGYEETSMLNKAGNLQGRLLLIHGDEDPTVVMQHSSLFLKASIKAGKHPDFFIYPGHGHNMTGKDRVHLHEHITRYFDDFLK